MMLFDAQEIPAEGQVRVPPKEFLVLRFGKTQYTKGETKGEIDFGDEDADKIILDFASRDRDLVVDYEHQTLTGDKAPAAGWIDRLSKTGEGLVATVRYWTETAKKHLEDGEYRYFSPVIKTSRRHPFALHSLALTNHPAMHGTPALVADDSDDELQSNTEKEIPMENLQPVIEKLGVEVVALADGQPDVKSTLDRVCEKLDAILGSAQNTQQFLSLHDAKSLDEVTAKIGQMVPAEEKLALEAKLVGIEAEKAVQQVLSDGKICEAQRVQAMKFASRDLQAFTEFYAVAPRLVPGSSPVGDVAGQQSAQATKTVALSDAEKAVFKRCGLSETDIEDIKKSREG